MDFFTALVKFFVNFWTDFASGYFIDFILNLF